MRWLAALPAGAGVCYLGVMLARPAAPLRLNVFGLQGKGLADYVNRLGWNRAATALHCALQGDLRGMAYEARFVLNDLDEVRRLVGMPLPHR